MKKLYTLLTAVVMMAVGSVNALAEDVTTLYERGTAVNAWQASDASSWGNTTFAVSNNVLTAKGTNGSFDATMEISPASTSIVTLTATINGGSASGRSGSYDYITIGGVSIQLFGQDKKAAIVADGVSTNLSGFSRGDDYNIVLTIDGSKGEVAYDISGGATGTGTTKTNTAITSVSVGHNKAGRENYEVAVTLKSIKITEEKQNVQTADYTINYIFNGTTIKSVEGSSTIGNTINAESPIVIEEQKYFAANGAETSKTIASGKNILNVNLRKANEFSYSVKTNFGETLSTGTVVEGEIANVTYPRYQLVNNTIYEAAKQGTNPWYGKAIEVQADNTEEIITYNALDNDIVFYSEAEEIEGASATASSNANIRCSNGLGGYATEPVSITTLPAGSYKVFATIWGNTGVTININAGNETILAAETKGYSWDTSAEFVLTEETTITFEGADANHPLDLIYIQKLTPASAKMVITDAKYATFCAPFDVAIPTGVTASKVSDVADNVLDLVELSETIPANTPVILYSESEISETVTGVEVAGVPKVGFLTGVYANTEITEGYVLQSQEGKVAFYLVDSAITVPANRAYLTISSSESGAKAINFPSATAIKAIEALTSGAKIYDVNGREINKLQKGINIVNGVKVMVK